MHATIVPDELIVNYGNRNIGISVEQRHGLLFAYVLLQFRCRYITTKARLQAGYAVHVSP